MPSVPILASQEPTDNPDVCTVCSGQLIFDPDCGEELCGSCGIVARDNIELAGEWFEFPLEEMAKQYRTGAPASLMMHDWGLSSFIYDETFDAVMQQTSVILLTLRFGEKWLKDESKALFENANATAVLGAVP